MTKKKNTSPVKKLIPAVGMLAVSASMLATSTYAWFTMNKEVRVTGMEVKTQVGDSLLIATSSYGTGKAADSTFQNGLHQAVYGLVNPVSTINGSDGSFYYTYDANADGSKSAATDVIAYNAVGSSDSFTVGSTTYKAYLDYVFEIKAINTNSSAQYLNLTGLNLLYDGQQLSDEHAYRVAIFSQNLTAAGATTYVAATTGSAASKIFAPTGFAYFGSTAVSSTTEKAAVSPTVNDASAGWSKQIAANSTDYTKITVRLWLEGEDNTCFSEKFSEKLDKWTLDLKFDLEANTTNAVKLIGSAVTATADPTSKVATLSVGTETAAAYKWYKCAEGGVTDNDTVVDGQTTNTLTASAAGKYYCVITTAKGTQFRTNSITVAGA
jgi:hypothetical protein